MIQDIQTKKTWGTIIVKYGLKFSFLFLSQMFLSLSLSLSCSCWSRSDDTRPRLILDLLNKTWLVYSSSHSSDVALKSAVVSSLTLDLLRLVGCLIVSDVFDSISQNASVTLRAPSAPFVTPTGVSVSVAPTWSVGTATDVLHPRSSSDPTAAEVRTLINLKSMHNNNNTDNDFQCVLCLWGFRPKLKKVKLFLTFTDEVL